MIKCQPSNHTIKNSNSSQNNSKDKNQKQKGNEPKERMVTNEVIYSRYLVNKFALYFLDSSVKVRYN